ncbi:MAG: hypothetical protein M0R50_08095 [Candidatus Cloacimonetes bacterium]|jgi:hypothetical protein|nr:hypothetical protein [Candidatus Cloacimonadota bacterium]
MSIQNSCSVTAQLPSNPYDGQIWVDGNLVRWKWSSEFSVWVNIGSVNSYAIADATTTGLMSSQDKRFLDSIPPVAGAFGIVTDQSAIIRSPDNRVGLVSGAVKLHSDSIDVECVDVNGSAYLGQALPDDPTGKKLSGIKFSLKDKFLDALCLEVVGPTGQTGATGATGIAGTDGFNDGPTGATGAAGADAETAYAFSGIKVIDSSDIVDTAVVALQMDGTAGRLSYTTAKMNVPSNSAPADQLTAQPIQRSLSYPTVAASGKDYVTLDDWSLSIPSGDLLSDDAEVLLVKMPADIAVGEIANIELTKLTDLISVVVDSYKEKLASFQTTWLAQMKAYIEEKDSAAREILSSLAQDVSLCEFKRPLEFCLGIAPSDCSQGVAMTQLTSDITIDATTIYVDSADNFPSDEAYTVIVAGENMYVSGGWGTTTWTVIRGYDSTTATTHASGTVVTLKIEVVVPIVSSGSTPQPAPTSSTITTSSTTTTDSSDTNTESLTKSSYSPIAIYDPTNPAKCLLPYRMMLIIITDESNPIYVTGIPDSSGTLVNYYNNDKAEWEKFIDNLTPNQKVALGILQIPKAGSEYYGDIRDLKCADCTLPYDSLRDGTFYHLLSEQSPKITSSDIVTFVNEMLDNVEYGDDSNPLRMCGGEFLPNQINILYKSKALSTDATSILAEQAALDDAIAELQQDSNLADVCFVSAISSSSTTHNQDDRWLRDATTTASRYLCYQCPTSTIPGTDKVVIMCITDEAGPIYSYDGYLGPDGESGPVGVPPGMSAWDYDLAKWKDSLAALSNSSNKVRLGILQPLGNTGTTVAPGGLLKPNSSAWPGDSDRKKITITKTNVTSFTPEDMLTSFKAITDNNDYAATILYVVVDTSGSLGDPTEVNNIVTAGVTMIQKTYTSLHISTDIVDIGTNKRGELAEPPLMSGYTIKAADSKYLWGYQYVSPAKSTILFPTVYVRSTIDAAERWLGRAVGIVEQLIYYWMPKPAYIPTAAYQMLLLVITDESSRNEIQTTNDGYHSYEGSGVNVGYENYKTDKALWNTWLSSLCTNQYAQIGVLQLANPGSPDYPEQTDRGPDQYTLADGSKTAGWVIDQTHDFKQDESDILPDTSWGTNINLVEEDGSLPKDSKGTITHKVIPWRGFGEQRVTAEDVMAFYNEITNDGSSCPDIIAVLLDTTESMKPTLTYWIKDAVLEHNNTTHGVTVDQSSPLSYYDETLGRWIGPRKSGTIDTIETDVGSVMMDEINASVLALQSVAPISGYTTYGYKHPLVVEIGYNGRWLQAVNAATTYFLNKTNDDTFHIGDDAWWSSYSSTACAAVANTTVPCTSEIVSP